MKAPTLNQRDKWLCAALPSLLALLVYGLAVARPLLRDCRSLRAELARQDPAPARAARLAAARAEHARLDEALATEQKRAEDLRDATAATGLSSPASQVAALAGIARSCEAFNLVVLILAPEPGPAPGREDVAGGARWRLELRGPYAGMVHLLDSLTSDPVPLMPMGLDMAPAGDDGTLIDWVLILAL